MKFDWEDFLKLADLLAKNQSKSEAVHRTIISRAYYACYGIASTYLKENHSDKVLIDNYNAHRQVIDAFKSSDNKKWTRIGSWLYRLRDFRNRADYDDEIDEDLQALATKSVSLGKQILSSINQL